MVGALIEVIMSVVGPWRGRASMEIIFLSSSGTIMTIFFVRQGIMSIFVSFFDMRVVLVCNL